MYLIEYGIREPIEGKWFIPAYVLVKNAKSEKEAIDKFEASNISKRKDRWKSAKVSAIKLDVID